MLRLYTAFHAAGITVDEEVFNDYLAIKYLRNTIVHGEWDEEQKHWLEQHGFPTDTRKLTEEHLDRMLHVNQNMMFYMALTSLPAPGASLSSKPVRLDESTTRQEDGNGILRLQDLNRIIWNNMDRMHMALYKAIEQAATNRIVGATG